MKIKYAVAALFSSVMYSLPLLPTALHAEPAPAEMMQRLAEAKDDEAAAKIERRVLSHWGRSGSASMDLLLRRGMDSLEQGAWVEAEGHLRALTDHAPDFAEGWAGLAAVYFRMELFGPSLDALGRALVLNPQHFGALRGVASIHELSGRPALAYEAYQRVLDLRPHDSVALDGMARLERQVRGKAL